MDTRTFATGRQGALIRCPNSGRGALKSAWHSVYKTAERHGHADNKSFWDYKGRVMKSRCVRSVAIAACAALGILPVLAQAQLVDLAKGTGSAINNAGQVVLSTGIDRDGTITPLPALPGQTTPAAAVTINATGQIVGSADISVGPAAGVDTVAVEYSSGTSITNKKESTNSRDDRLVWIVHHGAAPIALTASL
jgi:hypothetical protein